MKDFLSFLKKKKKKEDIFFDSAVYWEQRYVQGGNSGAGSYNRLAEFKAWVLNEFCTKNNIKKIIEFGCGDGNQLKLSQYNKYIGLDVSKKSIELCLDIFKGDSNKEFYVLGSVDLNDDKFKGDLVISLDVIYHLIEDNIFENYMNNLFASSNKFVIIYSSNYDSLSVAIHVKHRNFANFVKINFPDFKQIDFIKNKYPFDESDPDNTSFADFYIYKKINYIANEK